MSFAIELYFDAVAESRIRSLWDEFAAVGASSMRDSGARPHVSLAVCESVDLSAIRSLLDRFAAVTSSFPLALSSLGVFPLAEPVAFLAPKITPELLALHARFFSEFAAAARDYWAHYSPSQWVPHCTLATRLQAHQLGRVFDVGRAASLPLACTVTEIGLVEFPPARHLYTVPLQIAAPLS